MGLRDHVICDSDLHVMEPPDLWERYIDPAYAHAAPRGLSEITRDMRVRVKNNVMLRMGATRPQRVEGRKTGWQKEHDTVYAASEARGWDAQSQIDAMNAEGLDLAVLFPSRGLFVLGLDSAEQIGTTAWSPSSPRRSPGPTTTGSRTSATTRPTACSDPAWWRRTTSTAPSPRPGAAWRSSASRRSSCRRRR